MWPVLAKVRCAAVVACKALDVFVEVDAAGGLPGFVLVGLGSLAVRESGVRVRAALLHSGWKLPARKLVVNLAPADLRKDGAAYDLPVAIGVLAAQKVIPAAALEGLMLLGELSLDGRLRPVSGAIPVALHARQSGARALILPTQSAAEAACVDGVEIRGADSLLEVAGFLNGQFDLPFAQTGPRPRPPEKQHDLAEVQGLLHARLALEVAAAGGHHLLLIGAPGAGKSMLAQRLPTILPPLGRLEAIETSMIYSAAGLGSHFAEGGARPFRAPHHDASTPAIVGGGPIARPGEISLAHNGVLFLDELPEFDRPVLQSLRQPLEEQKITIARASGVAEFPARFQLVAAMNPCPCGYYGSARRSCTCDLLGMRRYRNRVSGPLFDRFDLQIIVPQSSLAELTDPSADKTGESSQTVLDRVLVARDRQAHRLAGTGAFCNAQVPTALLWDLCRPHGDLLRQFTPILELRAVTARGLFRILRVARTIADLDDKAAIERQHLLTAIEFRALDDESAT